MEGRNEGRKAGEKTEDRRNTDFSVIIFRLSSEASLIYLPFSSSIEALKEPTVAEDRWLVVPRSGSIGP